MTGLALTYTPFFPLGRRPNRRAEAFVGYLKQALR